MKPFPPRLIPGLFGLFVLIVWPLSASAQQTFSKATLEITSGERRHVFIVEVAETARQREQGLMWRKSLPVNTGMFFIFEQSRPLNMWMKNTYVALDMLFADEDGKIVSIARNTTPQSLKVISSRAPARYVLEVRAGTADRLSIIVGDRMRLRRGE